jgi:anti-sigma B factor antagonist
MEDQVVQPSLTLTTDRQEGRAVVTVDGELDAHSAQLVDDEVERLLADGVTELVFDLSAIEFLDSFGLRALLAAEGEVANLGASFVLRAPSRTVERLLDIAGLTEHFVVES